MARTGQQVASKGAGTRTKGGAKPHGSEKAAKRGPGADATTGTSATKGEASSKKAGPVVMAAGAKAAAKPARKSRPLAAAARGAQEETPGSAKTKQKLVRDSFTMPKQDFALIDTLKDRMVAYRRPTKKSELLRAGLHALMALPDARLSAALDELAPLKAGRPKKSA